MVLVDTSVWIAHLRQANHDLQGLLLQMDVACHPLVIGELACGNLGNRQEIIELLQALPQAATVSHEEALRFIEARRLMGRGIGFLDVHLLAAATVSDLPLWTYDRRLRDTAVILGISFD